MRAPTLFVAGAVLGAWAVARAAVRHAARRLPRAAVDDNRLARCGHHLRARFTEARTWRAFDQRLPDAVAAVARSLRSGASLQGAVAEAAAASAEPVASALKEVVASSKAGTPLTDALEAWARRCPRPNVLLLVAALSLAHETGGASAQAVDGVAATLRRRQVARAEVVALATQARTSAYVLAAMPLVVCLLAVAGGGGPARFLLGTPTGIGCLVLGIGLQAVGAWWMARLTRAAGASRVLP